MSNNLLMITGLGSARDLASGKKGAFYNTLEELHTHWDRIDIIVPHVKNNYSRELFGNVFLHVSPWPIILQPWFFIQEGLRIKKEHNFGLMTVQEFAPFYNGIGACLLSILTGVPYILEIMHIPGLPKSGSFKESIYKYLTRFFIGFDSRKAKVVRVINKQQTRDFLIRSGVSEKKIRYIPAFYIDLQTFKPKNIPKKYDVIFVGRLVPNKGIDLFLDIVSKANLKAMVVGDGPLLSFAKDKARNENLNIDFHGYAKDSIEIAELINQARVLLMTSLNEGGPRVILEALACGVPVLATPVGIVQDVLPSESIEDWDSAKMALKINNLLTDHTLYNKVRENGLIIAKEFERSRSIANYSEELKKILQN